MAFYIMLINKYQIYFNINILLLKYLKYLDQAGSSHQKYFLFFYKKLLKISHANEKKKNNLSHFELGITFTKLYYAITALN